MHLVEEALGPAMQDLLCDKVILRGSYVVAGMAEHILTLAVV